MPKTVLIDQFHIDLYVPRDLDTRSVKWMRRTLDGKQFRTRLGRAVRAFLRAFPALPAVRIRITQ
jgi:hypothetical protein